MVFASHACASLAVVAFFYRKYQQDSKIMALVLASSAFLGGVLIPDSPVALKILLVHLMGMSPDRWSASLESEVYTVVSSLLVWLFLVFYIRNLKKMPDSRFRCTELVRQANVLAVAGLLHVLLDLVSHENVKYLRDLERHYFWPLPFELGSWLSESMNSLTGYQYTPMNMHSLGILLPGDIFGWVFTFSMFALAYGILTWPK